MNSEWIPTPDRTWYKRFPVAICALLVGSATSLLAATQVALTFQPATNRVAVYDYHELAIRVANPGAQNPFTEIQVSGYFQMPGQAPQEVDGFCDAADGSLFRIRFMPNRPGPHQYTVTYRQGDFTQTYQGTFEAVSARKKGMLRVDREHPWHFLWEGTGEHYFWNGTTTYYLMGWDEETIRQSIDRLHRLKVNRLRVLIYGRNNHSWGEPVKAAGQFKFWLNPWPAQRPDDVANPGFDLTRFNVEYWQKYERLLRFARERDVIISVIPFIGYQVLPTPFAAYSEDEKRYYRYAVARLAPFSNVTWDLGNEHESDREVPKWADWLGPLVKEWDPYDHLLSVHNRVYYSPWIDMQLIQHWDIGAEMLSYRQRQAASGRIVPQVNEEYGYEDHCPDGKPLPFRAADTRRRFAWQMAMVGCYQTTGETAKRGTGHAPDTGGGWINGRGDDSMTLFRGFGHMVDFFTSFEWWRLEPRSDLVSGGALCLAQPGQRYAVYLPHGGETSVQFGEGCYQANWFNPRTGETLALPVAHGPVWFPPTAPDTGDWALRLERTAAVPDTTPPRLHRVHASAEQVRVAFTKLVEPGSAVDRRNYTIQPTVDLKGVQLAEDGRTAILSISSLVEGQTYTLTVSGIRDRANPPNTLPAETSGQFSFRKPRPIVELRFSEGKGDVTRNTGTAGDVAKLTRSGPKWTTNVAGPFAAPGALDFGTNAEPIGVDLSGVVPETLKGHKSFTITGWVNARSAQEGGGGNRLVSTINNGGDGLDLVFLGDGSLQIGINQWPDRVPARSSAGQIPVDSNGAVTNWRFFAVTYDATLPKEHVKFYFGSASQDARLDRAVTYGCGAVGERIGPALTVGHFNPASREPDRKDRMFRGLLDEVRVYGSVEDASGALALPEIIAVQRKAK